MNQPFSPEREAAKVYLETTAIDPRNIGISPGRLDSKQAKDGFHCDPCGDGSLGPVSCRNELPAADRFHRAFIQAKSDAFDNADRMGPAILAHKNLQSHGTLYFAVPRIVGIRRIRTIRASRRNESGHVTIMSGANSIWPLSIVAKTVATRGPYAMPLTGAWGVRISRHPGQPHFFRGSQNWRRSSVENGGWLG